MRNQVMYRALTRLADVENLTDDHLHRSILVRSILITLRAVPYLIKNDYDFIFVGFYGHIIMLLIGWWVRKPILFDAFISTYDTIIFDRKQASAGSFLARAAFWLDRTVCSLADHILLDTRMQVDYFVHTFGIEERKFSAVPVGCNESIFYPRPRHSNDQTVRVLYYCTYLPLHGVDVVVQAAALLQDLPLRFRIVGNGLEYGRVRQLAHDLQVKNIDFVPPMSLEQLGEEIGNADICLGGHFGMSEKAGRVVPGKIFQMLASERPVIASDHPANIELLTHGQSAWLCPPGDPTALAKAIDTLSQSSALREELGRRGRDLYQKAYSEISITAHLQSILDKFLGRKF